MFNQSERNWCHFKMKFVVICLLVWLRVLRAEIETTTVQIEQGWLAGELLDLVTEDGQYYSFKGIPYAAPPVGKLRFRAPQAPVSWDGVRNATEFGSVCPQVDVIFTGSYIPGSEDCLFLNVYTPALTPKEPLPVLVFIHGGAMKCGNGNYFGPDYLMSHGVILVTFNYRLDALGFLSLDTEEIPGNAGMKDQVKVLEWVRKNIGVFGGDADKVTIMGSSSGAASVGWHLLSALSKGLFKRGIAMSGAPFDDWAVSIEPKRRAFALARDLGKIPNDTNELVEFLESQPVEQLVNKTPILRALDPVMKDHTKFMPFTTCSIQKNFSNSFVAATLEELLKAGLNEDVDLMVGHSSDEALIYISQLNGLKDLYEIYQELYVPTDLLMSCPPSKYLALADKIQQYYYAGIDNTTAANVTLEAFMNYISDSGFNEKVYKFYNNLQRSEDSTRTTKRYMYQFSAITERNYFGNQAEAYNLTGTAHMDELFYLFNMQMLNTTIDKDGESYKIIQQTCELFTNFVKYGNPTPDHSTLGVTWPEYEDSTRKYLDISNELTVGERLNEDMLIFWQNLYNDTEGLCCAETSAKIYK